MCQKSVDPDYIFVCIENNENHKDDFIEDCM